MQSIYQYQDHKSYLGDWFQERKKSPSGFSYEKFSKLAGLGSPNYMKLVIAGKRNLTVANIHHVANGMTLNFDETQYFEALTLLGQSKSNQEKKYFRQRIAAIKKNKPTKTLQLGERDLISQWYFPAVVVCLDGCLVNEAMKTVKNKTRLSPAEIERTIQTLKKKNILEEKEGKYRIEFSHFLSHDKKSLSEINKKYLREQMKVSVAVLERKYALGPKFFSHTFTVATGAFEKYVEKLGTFLDSITAESNTEPADEIVQLNIQLFKFLDRP